MPETVNQLHWFPTLDNDEQFDRLIIKGKLAAYKTVAAEMPKITTFAVMEQPTTVTGLEGNRKIVHAYPTLLCCCGTCVFPVSSCESKAAVDA